MRHLASLGRMFFASALIGLGIGHFVFREFVTGRAPQWPDAIPGGLAWAYVTGLGFIAVSVALITGRRARYAAALAATLVFAWAFLRHIPVVAADSFLAPSWTSAGKALMLSGGILAVAGTLPREAGTRDTTVSRLVNLSDELVLLGRVCLGIFMVITGIQHFLFTEFVASLIPGWIPGDARLWTYFTGVALIAGGAGLQLRRTAKWAALLSGLMVFSWFWIVHVPRTLTSVSDGIAVFEALAVSGIAFAIAGTLSQRREIAQPVLAVLGEGPNSL